MELAGCDCRAMFEFNACACETLRANWNGVDFSNDKPLIFDGDVRQTDYSQLPTLVGREIDGVVGGPPCQPFSMGGVARGSDDSRNMFPEAARAVAKLRPTFFVFENVKGLLRENFAGYFNYVLLQLTFPFLPPLENENWDEHWRRLQKYRKTTKNVDEKASYQVAFRLFDAADFGSPQRRFRVFIVGIRNDLNIVPSFPAPTCSYDRKLWEQWISGEYWDQHKVAKKNRPTVTEREKKRVGELRKQYGLFPPPGERWQTVRDALKGLPDPLCANDVLNHEYRDGASLSRTYRKRVRRTFQGVKSRRARRTRRREYDSVSRRFLPLLHPKRSRARSEFSRRLLLLRTSVGNDAPNWKRRPRSVGSMCRRILAQDVGERMTREDYNRPLRLVPFNPLDKEYLGLCVVIAFSFPHSPFTTINNFD